MAYYRALREYLFSIPDGHVALIKGKSFNDDGLGTYQEEVDGGFGMTVARLDDGQLIVNWVKEGGPAGSAGIKAGTEIIEWDGKPAETALKETSTLWSILPQATDAGRDYERTRFMMRAPVETSRRVTFNNPGEAPTSTSLIAMDDGMETLMRTNAYGGAFSGKPPEKAVESRWLEGGIGYIKIYGEGDKEGQAPTTEQFLEMVSAFETSNATGLIFDIRVTLAVPTRYRRPSSAPFTKGRCCTDTPRL